MSKKSIWRTPKEPELDKRAQEKAYVESRNTDLVNLLDLIRHELEHENYVYWRAGLVRQVLEDLKEIHRVTKSINDTVNLIKEDVRKEATHA